jgi:cobalt-zinc-cadmium efflux system outer membrane protein
MRNYFSVRHSLILIICFLATACATKPAQDSLADVEQALEKQYPDIVLSGMFTSPPEAINLQGKLDLQQSLQMMLTHSPRVTAHLAKLGIVDAQKLQTELIDNPHISIAAMKPEDGGRWSLETGISQPLLSLFTRPLRRQLAEDSLAKVQLQLQDDIQQLIAQTTKTYFAAVAAQQNLKIQEQMHQASLARQQLALAMYQAGNISENKFLYYEQELQLAQQTLQQRQARARQKQFELANLLGLSSSQLPALPQQLPALPKEEFDHPFLLEKAKENRLDIKIIQQQLTQLQKRRQLIAKENGWRDMSIGINAEREFDGSVNAGPEIEFSLPLFNRGQGKIAVIDSKISQLQAESQQQLLNADSEIALALNQLASARKQEALIRKSLKIAERRVFLSNREVNFMLTSPFELLAIKRQEIQLAHQLTEQIKNYWQARSQLELAIGQALAVNHPKTHLHHPMNHTDHSAMDHSSMNHSKTKKSDKNSDNTHDHHQHHQSHSNHQEHHHD